MLKVAGNLEKRMSPEVQYVVVKARFQELSQEEQISAPLCASDVPTPGEAHFKKYTAHLVRTPLFR